MFIWTDLTSDVPLSGPGVRCSSERTWGQMVQMLWYAAWVAPASLHCSLQRCSSTYSHSAIKALLDFSTSFRASGSIVRPRVRLRALQPRDKRTKCPARAPGQQAGPHSHLQAPYCVLFISSHLLFMGDFLERGRCVPYCSRLAATCLCSES